MIDTNKVQNSQPSGLIEFLAGHRTAANLIMLLMIISGVWGTIKMNTQFLPSFGIDVVTVVVKWPGANAEDVDRNIVQAIEPEVRYLDAVKKVRSTSYEGLARISVEFEAGSDMQSALSNVESALARVTTLPEDSRKPEIRRIVRYETISRLILSGPVPEAALKAHAKKIRDDLLAIGVDKVDLFGDRGEEILVEVKEESLRRLDLTLEDIAMRIKLTSVDLPSGDIGAGARQVRSVGALDDAQSLGVIEVRSLGDGRKIHLRDIAMVKESFDDDAAMAFRNDYPAVELHFLRSIDSDALVIAKKIDDYLDVIEPTLPRDLKTERYDFATNLLEERINLLVRNGISGLIVVAVILFVFLEGAVAFWVLVGIPVSFMAAFGVMFSMGQTVNMISLFALIMALGIVVDDAIVVGEHAEYLKRKGKNSLKAAVEGAQRMATPVICASLTTVCAFLPLILIGGVIGQIILVIPMVIVAVILASLMECFFVLPGHLGHSLQKARNVVPVYMDFRKFFESNFSRFRDNVFCKLVTLSTEWRYVTISAAFSLLILAVGLLIGGRVNFNFFPTPEANKIMANIKMVAGTPRAETVLMLKEVERAAYASIDKELGEKQGIIRMISIKVGMPVLYGSGAAFPSGATDDASGGLIIELEPADKRMIRTPEFIKLWRKEINFRPGLKTLTIQQAKGGPPGRDVDIRLLGSDVRILKAAASEVSTLLGRYPGISDVEDNVPFGKPEIILQLTQRGRSLGFTTESVGRQVRNAIEGKIANKFTRGDEEVLVRIVYPRSDLKATVLETLYLRAGNGQEIPLGEVVSKRNKLGFAQVKRENGKRQIAITAEVDSKVTSTAEVISAIKRDGILDICERFGVEAIFAGKAEERMETFSDMKLGFIIGLCGIFIVLAWVFSSYSRPLAIMATIPMGFIGATLGHWLLGYNLTILSLIGLVGLSGIVVNGSIILVTTVEERLKHESFEDAIVGAACDRLRPIILTSATTIGGLLPLIFETSLQAQFLIPMAITIIFGLGVSSILVLFVVPAFLCAIRDITRVLVGR